MDYNQTTWLKMCLRNTLKYDVGIVFSVRKVFIFAWVQQRWELVLEEAPVFEQRKMSGFQPLVFSLQFIILKY